MIVIDSTQGTMEIQGSDNDIKAELCVCITAILKEGILSEAVIDRIVEAAKNLPDEKYKAGCKKEMTS